LTSFFSGEKYQPPERFAGGDSMRQPGAFHKYTTIQHYYRYGNAIPVGTPVRITEKIHGTNSRVGLVLDGLCCDKGDGLEFMCGTHHRRVMSENKGRASLYWTALSDNMQDMLNYISACASQEDVIVFGEIYGNKVQPMDYGCPKGKGYRVFDISVNGEYLDWCDIMTHCRLFDIETVPLLYEGPFSPDLIELSNGPTHLAGPEQIKCGFKGREGIVITPLAEQHSDELGGRLILKAVSPDYYEAMG
jgi:RNA ligase (TIGR02306 family)